MPSFVSLVNNFFSFRESFSRRPSVVFSRREERLCSPLLSKSTTFFPSCETFCSAVGASRFSSIARSVYAPLRFQSQPLFSFCETFVPPEASRFPQSRGAVMLPYALEVNFFFPFRETSFHHEAKLFSSIAMSGYAPLCSQSQPFISFPRKFFAALSVKRFPLARRGKLP